MDKCIRCGGSFLTRRKLKLADGFICPKCFRALGFDKTDELISHLYSYEDIKDGADAYYQRRWTVKEPAPSVSFSNYGQARDLDETDGETEIFELVKETYDLSDLELIRRSGNYVTAQLGDWDLVRIKFTDRAKWLIFPTVEAGSKKHHIEAPQDVLEHDDLIRASLEHIKKYT